MGYLTTSSNLGQWLTTLISFYIENIYKTSTCVAACLNPSPSPPLPPERAAEGGGSTEHLITATDTLLSQQGDTWLITTLGECNDLSIDYVCH